MTIDKQNTYEVMGWGRRLIVLSDLEGFYTLPKEKLKGILGPQLLLDS